MRSVFWAFVLTTCITTVVQAGDWPLLMIVNIGDGLEMGKQLGITAIEVSPGIKFNPGKFEIENGEPANRSTQRLVDNVELAEKNDLIPVISLHVQDACYKHYDYQEGWEFGPCYDDSLVNEQEVADGTIEKIREMHAYFRKLSGGGKGRAENRIKLWRIGNEVQRNMFRVPPHVYAYFFQELSEEFATDDAHLAATFAVGNSHDTWFSTST